jgi:membrane-associated phospholipid phosphatase
MVMRFPQAIALAVSALIVCYAATAQAAATTAPAVEITATATKVNLSGSHFQFHALADISALALSSSAIVLPMTLDHTKYWEKPLGSPDDINWLDHFALNRWSPNAAKFADLLAGGSIVLPLAFTAYDTLHNHHPKGYFLDEAGVFSESVLVTIGVTELAKHLVHRPRPYVYNEDVPESEKDKTEAYLSFWSAHTAVTACALTSFAYIQMKDNPGKAFTKLALVGAVSVIPTVGLLMVISGHHFPSDVLVGAGVGSALGLLVPYLHLRHDGGIYGSVSPSLIHSGDGMGFTVNLAF